MATTYIVNIVVSKGLLFVKVEFIANNANKGALMSATNYFFKNDEVIDGEYKVKSFFAINDYAQTYRVRNQDFEAKVLKLFLQDATDELAVLARLDNPNVVKLDRVGDVAVNGQSYRYAILDFVNGESLSERVQRDEPLSFIGARNIFYGIINGLIYLRRLHPPVQHNRLLPKYVLLNLASNTSAPVIANYSFSSGKNIHYLDDELYFVGAEAFTGDVLPSSDLYAAGAIYYYLLHGFPPFSNDLQTDIAFSEAIRQKKKMGVEFYEELYESTQYIIAKALHPNPENRYQEPAEIRRDLYKDPHDPSFTELLAALRD